MLLTDLQTRVGLVAERAIPDAALLLAAQEVVNAVEGKNPLLAHRSLEPVLLDGSYNYTLTAATQSNTVEVFYASGAEDTSTPWVRLVENALLVPPTVGDARPLYYYKWLTPTAILLDQAPAAGSLSVYYRGNALLTMDSAPDHPSLFPGVLAWFGRNIWQDQRTEGWEAEFERAWKAELATALRRSAPGNLGERN